MTPKKRIAAIEGLHTLHDEAPHLIGTRCTSCGTYFFPRQTQFCRNPKCDSASFEDVELSRTGRIWSYTNACYQPPEPYVATPPYEPFAIAAVELEKEKMIVLGQVVQGIDVGELEIGLQMELVLETLYVDGDIERVVWKWKPIRSSR